MGDVDAQIVALLLQQFARIHPALDFSPGAQPGVAERRGLLRVLKDGSIRLVEAGGATKGPAEDERSEEPPMAVGEEGEVAALRQRVEVLERDNKALEDLLESVVAGGAARVTSRQGVLDEVAAIVLDLAREQVAERGRDVREGSQSELLRCAAKLLGEERRVVSRLAERNAQLDEAITAEEVLARVRAIAQPARRRKGQIDPESAPNRRGKAEEPATQDQEPDQAKAPPGLEGIAEQRLNELREQLRVNREELTRKLINYLPTVEGCSFPTVEDSRAFVSELNLMLENAGERLAEPETGWPATLFVTNPARGPSGGYFSFKCVDPESGSQRSKGSYRSLPRLRLHGP